MHGCVIDVIVTFCYLRYICYVTIWLVLNIFQVILQFVDIYSRIYLKPIVNLSLINVSMYDITKSTIMTSFPA